MATLAGTLHTEVVAEEEHRRDDCHGDQPDHLGTLDVDTGQTLVVGHSAGGQLAAWAASRTARTPGGAPPAPLAGAVSLAFTVAPGAAEPAGRAGAVAAALPACWVEVAVITAGFTAPFELMFASTSSPGLKPPIPSTARSCGE